METIPTALEHSYPFDPSCGYGLEELLAVGSPDGPPDFSEFWSKTHQLACAVPLRLEKREIESPSKDRRVWEVKFDSLGGIRIGAWVTEPRHLDPDAGGWVVGHGYGGRGEPAFDELFRGAPAIFFCVRGFNLSAYADIPDSFERHVLHGIESPETYVHRGCVADIWAAASALVEMFPCAAKHLRYFGGSLGGGLGALALPWDGRFERAFLDVPSFGNHPLRLQFPGVGSGEQVRLYAVEHPDVLKALSYFDAATAARSIQIPVFVAAAMFDPAVAPPGQFAVFNALPGLKELFTWTSGHFSTPAEPTEQAQLAACLVQWFGCP